MQKDQYGITVHEYRGRTIEASIVCGSNFTVSDNGAVKDMRPKIEYWMVFDPDLPGIGYAGGYDTLSLAKKDILRIDRMCGLAK